MISKCLDIDIKTDLKKAKNDFEKDLLTSNAAFGETTENIRNHRDIKLVTTKRRRNKLVSEQNYHTKKFFTENILAIEMRITEILMNKPVYLELSKLELSKILIMSFGMVM